MDRDDVLVALYLTRQAIGRPVTVAELGAVLKVGKGRERWRALFDTVDAAALAGLVRRGRKAYELTPKGRAAIAHRIAALTRLT